jgi:putative phosphoribosyl transferase
MICRARRAAPEITEEVMFESREFHAALTIAPESIGLVAMCYAHGSSRQAAAQQTIASALAKSKIATCIAELLSPEEAEDPAKLNDVDLLAERTHLLLDLLSTRWDTRPLPLALLAADRSVPAALCVAQSRPGQIASVIACYGRPDFAPIDLSSLTVPTLFVVPGNERALVRPNERAFEILNCPSQLAVIVGASREFSEGGTLVACGYVVQQWCEQTLRLLGRSRQARS